MANNQTLNPSQRQALQETKNVLPGMKIKIEQALERLEDELVSRKFVEYTRNTVLIRS
jgi:tubulin-specific chaperone A